jgi:hypothetical protein
MKKSELRQIIKEEISKVLRENESGNAEYAIGDEVTVVKGGERIVVSKIGVDPKTVDYPTPGMKGKVSDVDKLKNRVYVVFPDIGKDKYSFQPNEIK